MFSYKIIAVALAAIMSVLSVEAQTKPPAANCQDAPGMANVNSSQLVGTWYQVYGAPAGNSSCNKCTVSRINNQTELYNITSNYAPSKTNLLMDKYEYVIVNGSHVNNETIFTANSTHHYDNATYRILDTDYISYAIICGSYNISNTTTISVGSIYTRAQLPTPTMLGQLKNNASQQLSIFNDSSAGNVLQSKDCRNSAPNAVVPTLLTLFAAFYALLKLI